MKRNSKFYLYIIVAVLLLTLVPAPRRGLKNVFIYVSRPIDSRLSNAAIGSRGFFSAIAEISSLRRENSDLAQKLKQMEVSSTELDELRHENETLKNQLGFLDQHKENNLVPARIIGREPFGALDKIIIDKGSNDGIALNAAVVSNGSLIGKVTEIHGLQATITLITSKDSIVQAMLENSRTLGIIKGSLEGVKLENIPQDTQTTDHEAIVTSGLGGTIAPGILIGWTKGVSSSKSEIYKTLDVDIAENLTKLELVFVVK